VRAWDGKTSEAVFGKELSNPIPGFISPLIPEIKPLQRGEVAPDLLLRDSYVVKQVIANFKTWRIMHTEYRRPPATFRETI
jgi:hypothetical protein